MKNQEISINNKIDQMRKNCSKKPDELETDSTLGKESDSHTKVIKRLEMKKAASRLGISNIALLKILRDRGHFIKCVNDNLPKPELIEKGYFENELRQFKRGAVKNNYIKVYVTANGMSFLSNLIKPTIQTGQVYLGMEIES